MKTTIVSSHGRNTEVLIEKCPRCGHEHPTAQVVHIGAEKMERLKEIRKLICASRHRSGWKDAWWVPLTFGPLVASFFFPSWSLGGIVCLIVAIGFGCYGAAWVLKKDDQLCEYRNVLFDEEEKIFTSAGMKREEAALFNERHYHSPTAKVLVA